MAGLKKYCSIGLLLLHLTMLAQAKKGPGNNLATADNITEQAHLDLNTDIVVSGEELLYKVTITTGQKPDSQNQSKIAYVRLLDSRGKTWFSDKIALSKRSGSGNYNVPAEAPSGNYKLIAYTQWSRNNPVSGYAVRDILIINPYLIPKDSTGGTRSEYIVSRKEDTLPVSATPSNRVTLNLNKSVYKSRESVHLDLKSIGEVTSGSYLLSVRKILPLHIEPEPSMVHMGLDGDEKVFLPEFRGELLSGRIFNKNLNGTVADRTISLSVPGKDFLFKDVKTDKNGKFLILLDKPYHTTDAYIQVIDANPENYNIQVDKNDPTLSDQLNFKKLTIVPSLENWLKKRSMDIQIMNAYTETFLGSRKIDSAQSSVFYDPYATRYILDDYDRFPTMHETFTEIIWDAAMRVDPDKVRLKVYNSENPFNDGLDKIDPLLLIDGIQIQDSKLVKDLDPYKVAYIDVVPEQYRYGPSYYSGIISIITKENNFALPANETGVLKFELPLPRKNAGYVQKNYDKDKDYKRIPDYRAQLYWNADVSLTGTAPLDIQFYTSDITGNFEVVLTGYNEKGEIISAKTNFAVEQ